MSKTCFVLATECLTIDIAHEPQLLYSFSFIMLMQVFFNLTPSFWGQEYFKQLEIICGQFQYLFELPLSTSLCFIILKYIFVYLTNFSKSAYPYPGILCSELSYVSTPQCLLCISFFHVLYKKINYKSSPFSCGFHETESQIVVL